MPGDNWSTPNPSQCQAHCCAFIGSCVWRAGAHLEKREDFLQVCRLQPVPPEDQPCLVSPQLSKVRCRFCQNRRSVIGKRLDPSPMCCSPVWQWGDCSCERTSPWAALVSILCSASLAICLNLLPTNRSLLMSLLTVALGRGRTQPAFEAKVMPRTMVAARSGFAPHGS